MGKAFKAVTKPFKKAFEWAGEAIAPEIDTSGQERAIREQAQQQARQAAESAQQAAATQSNSAEREQLLRQRAQETDDSLEGEADVQVGDGEYDTARKRRKQFNEGAAESSQSPSIRI